MTSCDSSSTNFACKECGKSFQHFRSLKRHVKSFHPDKLDEFSIANNLKFSCRYCEKKFHKLYLLKHHTAKVHPARVHNCAICSLQFPRRQLFNHFQEVHGISMSTEKLQFPSIDDFFIWKEAVEKDSNCNFKKAAGSKVSKNGTTCYYECHRSGYFQTKGNNLRKLKRSIKINSYCPASIKLTTSSDGTCNSLFVNTHIGHQNELSNFPGIKNSLAATSSPPSNDTNSSLNESDVLLEHETSRESSLPLLLQKEQLKEQINVLIDSLTTIEELNVVRRLINSLRNNPQSIASAFEKI